MQKPKNESSSLRQNSSKVYKTPTSVSYSSLSTTIEKLDYCDKQLFKLGKFERPSNEGDRRHGFAFQIESIQNDWITEKAIQLETYEETEFPEIRKHLVFNNILLQRIWNYSGKIYAEKNFELACL